MVELMNYTIQELAIRLVEAMIASRRAKVALVDSYSGNVTDGDVIKSLADKEYDTWIAMCNALENLSSAVNLYADNT